MKIELDKYIAQFNIYTERAKKYGTTCKTRDELREKIEGISTDALVLYNQYNNPKAENYPLIIKIFLDFDNLLKTIKREYESSSQGLISSQDPKRNAFFPSQPKGGNSLIYDDDVRFKLFPGSI